MRINNGAKTRIGPKSIDTCMWYLVNFFPD